MEIHFGTDVIIEKNIMVKMRDGVHLATDVYRPKVDGPVGVLVTRLPYNKEMQHFLILNMNIKKVFEAGYAIVIQDTRGRYASEGDFYPVLTEDTDGADTIEWAAVQPWSSGQVGMYGVSYQGITQWQAATCQPEALRAIAPTHAPTTIYSHRQGAFRLDTFQTWALEQGAKGELEHRQLQGQDVSAQMAALSGLLKDRPAGFRRLPLSDMPEIEGFAPFWWDFLKQRPDWPAQHQVEIYRQVQVPALNIGGWYDYFLPETLANYTGMTQHGGSELARQQQRLVIGPWTHVDFPGMFRERAYGPGSGMIASGLTERQLRWFDHWVKGVDNGVEKDEKQVYLFVMGADVWREETDWPLPDTQYRPYYLHSGGQANTLDGDGSLSQEVANEGAPDSFDYDPLNPVPTVGGAVIIEVKPGLINNEFLNTGPMDQRQVEMREDVLCYTTPPLEKAVEVTGPVELVLFVSSSAVDTDFSGKLVDMYPDGRAEILPDGLLRARYRNSLSEPELLTPDQVYELHIGLEATSNLFKAGHRIRLDVSSSNFPRFDRNTNTGGEIFSESAADVKTAKNRVYHDQKYPSRLILPVIERD